MGVPYWGLGLTPEAGRELLRYAFEKLNCSCVWCGHYEGNMQSRRVMEKCGFVFDHKVEQIYCRALDEQRTGYKFKLTADMWKKPII